MLALQATLVVPTSNLSNTIYSGHTTPTSTATNTTSGHCHINLGASH